MRRFAPAWLAIGLLLGFVLAPAAQTLVSRVTTVILNTIPTTTIQVPLSNANILSLPATPVQIIPAPGSGKRIQLVNAWASWNFTTGYTNVSSTFGEFNLQSAMGAWLTSVNFTDANAIIGGGGQLQSLHADLTTTGRHTLYFLPFSYVDSFNTSDGLISYSTDSTTLDNQAINIVANNNGEGNYTGGNASNSMTIGVTYQIVSVP